MGGEELGIASLAVEGQRNGAVASEKDGIRRLCFLRGKKSLFICCMGFSRESKMDNEGEQGENYYRFSLSSGSG